MKNETDWMLKRAKGIGYGRRQERLYLLAEGLGAEKKALWGWEWEERLKWWYEN